MHMHKGSGCVLKCWGCMEVPGVHRGARSCWDARGYRGCLGARLCCDCAEVLGKHGVRGVARGARGRTGCTEMLECTVVLGVHGRAEGLREGDRVC